MYSCGRGRRRDPIILRPFCKILIGLRLRPGASTTFIQTYLTTCKTEFRKLASDLTQFKPCQWFVARNLNNTFTLSISKYKVNNCL